MKIPEFTYILSHPHTISEQQTLSLESIVQEYPYFQAARNLYVKGLFNVQSYRYNHELKKAAAYTHDRNILFDFITTEKFETLLSPEIEELQVDVNNIIVVNPTVLKHEPSLIHKETLEQFLEKENKIKEERTSSEQILEIHKPLVFHFNEKHSFSEWLQLTKAQPIAREIIQNDEKKETELQKKINIIDKFIEANPKIKPATEITKTPEFIDKKSEEPSHLMTETLARIYLEQKKYNKAIQAYEILILKYPEKSSFFADRINEIKKLQQNN